MNWLRIGVWTPEKCLHTASCIFIVYILYMMYILLCAHGFGCICVHVSFLALLCVLNERTAACSAPLARQSMAKRPARNQRARWKYTASLSLFPAIQTAAPYRSSTTSHLEYRSLFHPVALINMVNSMSVVTRIFI